jgi:hypothetical protein
VPALPRAGRALGDLPAGAAGGPAGLPLLTTITAGGRTWQITWAEEKVQIKDYGEARQITLFEHGKGHPADPGAGF